MHKLLFLLFLLPLTSNAQLYISPIIGIDGLHLEISDSNVGRVEESFHIDTPTYGLRSTYIWNRLSLDYYAVCTKKEYDYDIIYGGHVYVHYPKFQVNIRKQSLVASYHFLNNFRIKTGVYHILLKDLTFIREDGIESETVADFQDYGIQMGLSYEYSHFFLTAFYNRGLKTGEDEFFKPSKSYSLYIGYQFKIFDTKWFNKKGQKCPKF